MHLIVWDLKHYYPIIFLISLFRTTVSSPVKPSPVFHHSQSQIWTPVYLMPHSFINNGHAQAVPSLRNAAAQIRDTSNFRGCCGTNLEIVKAWAHESKMPMCLLALDNAEKTLKGRNFGFVCFSEASRKGWNRLIQMQNAASFLFLFPPPPFSWFMLFFILCRISSIFFLFFLEIVNCRKTRSF